MFCFQKKAPKVILLIDFLLSNLEWKLLIVRTPECSKTKTDLFLLLLRQLIRDTKKVKDFNLRTGDIRGATVLFCFFLCAFILIRNVALLHNKVVKDSWNRNFIRDPNFIKDIQGAQASTAKKLETKRSTCPLNPKYFFI